MDHQLAILGPDVSDNLWGCSPLIWNMFGVVKESSKDYLSSFELRSRRAMLKISLEYSCLAHRKIVFSALESEIFLRSGGGVCCPEPCYAGKDGLKI